MLFTLHVMSGDSVEQLRQQCARALKASRTRRSARRAERRLAREELRESLHHRCRHMNVSMLPFPTIKRARIEAFITYSASCC